MTHIKPEVRVRHRAGGWALPDYSDLADCGTKYDRANEGRPLCTGTATWRIFTDSGTVQTFAFYCDNDLPAQHRPQERGAE
jgi:hypothetical protein